MFRFCVALAIASSGCTSIGVCYSEGGMTRGENHKLAIYTESLFQPLPSGEVAAVELGRGSILAARVEPCHSGTLERIPPDKVISVTFDPPSLAQYDGSRFDNDLIVINYSALAEGDGHIIVRAVFDGDEIEDRRAFRVRPLADVAFQPVDLGSDLVGPLVAGTKLGVWLFPTTAEGEPLVARVPGPGWIRADGQLEVVDFPWPADTDVGVKFPVAGTIPIHRGTISDWSWERTVPQTTIEVVPVTAITMSTMEEVSLPKTASSCGINNGFIVRTTLVDNLSRPIRGASALVVPSNPAALEIHLTLDPDELFVRCKMPGDYRLDLALPNAPASLMVHAL